MEFVSLYKMCISKSHLEGIDNFFFNKIDYENTIMRDFQTFANYVS